MTAKRFTMDNEVGMLDVPCCNIYDNGEFLGTVILSDGVKFSGLLNEQHEQIHFLNMKYAERTSIIGEQSLKIENLEKENEQLKQELFESEKECIMIDYRDNPIRRNDKIIDLKEEYKERFGRDFE